MKKLAMYVILAINLDGRKEVLHIEIGENESAKYWLGVLNSLKNRGLKDIFILCADGLIGLKEAVEAAFPQTKFQRCIAGQKYSQIRFCKRPVCHTDYTAPDVAQNAIEKKNSTYRQLNRQRSVRGLCLFKIWA